MDWVYKNTEPDTLLKDLATRGDPLSRRRGLEEVLSQGRLQAADTLRDRIQNSANERSLGAKIIFVGLQDIHPPTASDVAATYEKVVGAEQTKLAKILDAEAAPSARTRWPTRRRSRSRTSPTPNASSS